MHISCTGAHVAGFFNCEIWIHLNMIYNCSKISCIVIECWSDHEWFRLVQYTFSHNIFMTHLISGYVYLPDLRKGWYNIFRISTILLKTSFMKSVFMKKICPDVSNFVNVDNIMRQNRHNAEQTNPFYHEICFCDQCKRVISTRYPRVSFPSIYTIFKWLFLPVVIRYNMPI